MDINNTAMEQLSDKVKEGEIIMATAKAAGEKVRLGLPNVLNKNQSFPHVLCAIR